MVTGCRFSIGRRTAHIDASAMTTGSRSRFNPTSSGARWSRRWDRRSGRSTRRFASAAGRKQNEDALDDRWLSDHHYRMRSLRPDESTARRAGLRRAWCRRPPIDSTSIRSSRRAAITSTLPHSEIGTWPIEGFPAKFRRSPSDIGGPDRGARAPKLGEDNDFDLRKTGRPQRRLKSRALTEEWRHLNSRRATSSSSLAEFHDHPRNVAIELGEYAGVAARGTRRRSHQTRSRARAPPRAESVPFPRRTRMILSRAFSSGATTSTRKA